MRGKFTEDHVEQACLDWLESLGYGVLHGPDISPDGEARERARGAWRRRGRAVDRGSERADAAAARERGEPTGGAHAVSAKKKRAGWVPRGRPSPLAAVSTSGAILIGRRVPSIQTSQNLCDITKF